jgi:hypothetical protein
VLEGRCGLEQLDVFDDPELASWLLDLRKRLESARPPTEAAGARRLFYRLLDQRGHE